MTTTETQTKYQAWIVVKRHVRDFSPNEERRNTPHHIRGEIVLSFLREKEARFIAKKFAERSSDYNFWAMPQTAF